MHRNFVSHTLAVILYRSPWISKHINDERYLKLIYHGFMGKKLNLNNPKTFNEKLQWLKLYDRNPTYTKMVDKYEAKQYVQDIIGKQYIIPTLGVWDHFDDIDFDSLPDQFVLKCTHDSGGLVIVKDKNSLDLNKTRKKINRCLRSSYYYKGREWPYKNVKPRIIAEEYMEDKEGSSLRDYKLMCFNGKVKCSFVVSDRNTDEGMKVTFYDPKWIRMPFIRHYPSSETDIPKPLNYEKMVSLSETLSQGIKFLRVDFYEINGKIYFGELTLYPGSGYEEFTPEKWDYYLGDLIDLTADQR